MSIELEKLFNSDGAHRERFKTRRNFEILDGFIRTGGTISDNITATTISAEYFYSAGTSLQEILNNIGGSSSSTFTGGTIEGDTNFTLNLSASTFYSGSTELGDLIHNIVSNSTLQGEYLPLSGGVLTGSLTLSHLSGSTTRRVIDISSVGVLSATSVFITDSSIISNIETSSNWSIQGVYTGTSFYATAGQLHVDDNYMYLMKDHETPIRLIRG